MSAPTVSEFTFKFFASKLSVVAPTPLHCSSMFLKLSLPVFFNVPTPVVVIFDTSLKLM